MSLDGALSIATGGLANVNRRMAVVSQNVANAGTPGYAAEIATQRSLTADGVGLGVRSGPAIRNLDTMLQAEVFSQNATVAGLHTRQTALQSIDAAQGTPGQGDDIPSQLGKLQDQFSTLLNDPASAPQQDLSRRSFLKLGWAAFLGFLRRRAGTYRYDKQRQCSYEKT
jgi:flagellar hook-associated protein 1 FlgK